MSEDTARAIGAGSTSPIFNIDGKELTPRPLGIGELAELNRDCLKRYKKEYLETFSENRELFGIDGYDKLIAEKGEEAAKWDIGDLPPKSAYDSDKVKMTDALVDWVSDTFGLDKKTKVDQEERFKRTVAYALDVTILSDEEYEEKTGEAPTKLKVAYVNWWMTGHPDGMISSMWLCFKSQGISRDQIIEHVGRDQSKATDMVREIEHLSAPAMGNT